VAQRKGAKAHHPSGRQTGKYNCFLAKACLLRPDSGCFLAKQSSCEDTVALSQQKQRVKASHMTGTACSPGLEVGLPCVAAGGAQAQAPGSTTHASPPPKSDYVFCDHCLPCPSSCCSYFDPVHVTVLGHLVPLLREDLPLELRIALAGKMVRACGLAIVIWCRTDHPESLVVTAVVCDV